MVNYRPKETIQKFLISTTSRLVDEYNSNELLIAHAWQSSNLPDQLTLSENPLCRNSFVVAFETPPIEKNVTFLPDYSPTGDVICAYLAVFYGKRFDNHGPLEGIGFFRVPYLQPYMSISIQDLPQNNHSPRVDLGINLDLSEFSKIKRLFDDDISHKFIHFFNMGSRFYLQALQSFEADPEIAYLHLVTCAEILSNYYEYDKDDLLDENTKALLKEIENGLQDGTKLVKQVKSRLMQVKKRFVKTILYLINDHLFSSTESKKDYCRLKKEGIEQRVAAAYDLRSRYLHTGNEFSDWLRWDMAFIPEVQDITPEIDDKEFVSILEKAPTYFGLERIMRFCLLRFLHLECVSIDSKLD